MTPIQITIGAPGFNPSAIIAAVLPAVTALMGVWLTLWNTNRRSGREDKLNRGVASLALAEHLEDFVIHCSDVVVSVQNVVWSSPHSPADYSESPTWLKDLPPWPAEVDWRVIGFDLAVKASNFRRKVRFAEESVQAQWEHVDAEDAHVFSGEQALRLAPMAWELAQEVREAGGLQPFEWPDDWSALDNLNAWAERLAEAERKRNAAPEAEGPPKAV